MIGIGYFEDVELKMDRQTKKRADFLLSFYFFVFCGIASHFCEKYGENFCFALDRLQRIFPAAPLYNGTNGSNIKG